MAIRLKSKEEVEKMRVAGRIVRKVHDLCREICQPGITTRQIDQAGGELIKAEGGKGLFKGYPGPTPFPANLCISINQEVVHGIAGNRVIKDGDIVSIDCGVQVDGWCGDAATTLMVGNVGERKRRLCEVTSHVLELAIENVKPGRKWSQVAKLMENYACQAGMGVVKDYVGHGIGRNMHEDPKMPNFVNKDLLRNDIELREGMTLAIEPMCNLGVSEVMTLSDGWTVVTVDDEPSAHFEHTVVVTADGADVLTNGR